MRSRNNGHKLVCFGTRGLIQGQQQSDVQCEGAEACAVLPDAAKTSGWQNTQNMHATYTVVNRSKSTTPSALNDSRGELWAGTAFGSGRPAYAHAQ